MVTWFKYWFTYSEAEGIFSSKIFLRGVGGGEGTAPSTRGNVQLSRVVRKIRRDHFVFTKPLLKEAIIFFLHDCFFSIRNIITVQLIGIPMGSDPAPPFIDFFLPIRKLTGLRYNVNLEQIMFEKSIVPFSVSMIC